MATAKLTAKQLRLWAQDRPELNTLVDGIKFDDEQIDFAMKLTVDSWNTMPPPIGEYTIENFPHISLMLLGTWAWLLRGAAIGEAQNHLSYSAEGVSIDDRDKAAVFTQLGKDFWEEFKDTAKQIKIAQNIADAYGYKGSEFRYRGYHF